MIKKGSQIQGSFFIEAVTIYYISGGAYYERTRIDTNDHRLRDG